MSITDPPQNNMEYRSWRITNEHYHIPLTVRHAKSELRQIIHVPTPRIRGINLHRVKPRSTFYSKETFNNGAPLLTIPSRDALLVVSCNLERSFSPLRGRITIYPFYTTRVIMTFVQTPNIIKHSVSDSR